MYETPLAIIDVGSNSGRVTVLRVGPSGIVDIIEERDAPLRLVRDLGPDRRLAEDAIARTLRALRDFRAVANASGAVRILAVATAAVREASNGSELVARIRDELGIDTTVIDGQREAYLAFLGAISSLPVEHGMLVDLGGGSMQIVHFRERRPGLSWTLPLGALRLSDRFLRGDPPDAAGLRALADHVRGALRGVTLPRLGRDERLVGTGGTIRGLSRMARRRYPIDRLHGYELSAGAVRDVLGLLTKRKAKPRVSNAGLSADRADSITGGAQIVRTLMEVIEADGGIVSGQGLREGVALAALGAEPTSPKVMRRASIAALTARFRTWSAFTADRRAATATSLLAAVSPGDDGSEKETLQHAAHVLDIGRSVDYYRRHHHAAQILVAADVAGFSHREVALLAAIVGGAGQRRVRLKPYHPLLTEKDESTVARLAGILALAEELERRLPLVGDARVSCVRHGDEVICSAPFPREPGLAEVERRFSQVTGYRLRLQSLGLEPPQRERSPD